MLRSKWNVLAPCVAGALLWTIGAARKSLWTDEFHTLHHVREPDWGALLAVVREDNHPPLSFALQRLSVGLFGESEVALRLPGVIAGVALLALAARFAARLPGRVAPRARRDRARVGARGLRLALPLGLRGAAPLRGGGGRGRFGAALAARERDRRDDARRHARRHRVGRHRGLPHGGRAGDGVVAKPLWELEPRRSPTGRDYYVARLSRRAALAPALIPVTQLARAREHGRVWVLMRDGNSPWILRAVRRAFQRERTWHLGTSLELHLFSEPRRGPQPLTGA